MFDFLNNILLLSKRFFDTLPVMTYAMTKESLAVLINYAREKRLKPLFVYCFPVFGFTLEPYSF
jgi:hypothetical protein